MTYVFFQGDPEFVKYWNVVEKNRKNYEVPNIEAGLKKILENPKTVYFTREIKISAYYKPKFGRRGKDLPQLKVIKENLQRDHGMIFPKHSPLAPLFFEYGLKIFDNGVYQKLVFKWFGDGIPEWHETSHTIVSLDQTLFSFSSLFFAMIFAILVLGIEKVLAHVIISRLDKNMKTLQYEFNNQVDNVSISTMIENLQDDSLKKSQSHQK